MKNRSKFAQNFCMILLLSMIILFSSCSIHQTQNEMVDEALRLIKSNPDSVLLLLSNQKIIFGSTDYLKAKVKLFKFYAQYKTSDSALQHSLIDQARNYFIQTNHEYLKGLSFYLTGCSRELRNQTDSAVFWYKMADIVLTDYEETSEINGLVKYNLGYIYLQYNHADYALKYFKESFSIFKECENLKFLAYAMRDISYCYYLNNYKSEVYMKILDNAYKIAYSSNDMINCDFIMAQKGEFLYESDKKESKRLIKHHLLKYPGSEKLSSYLADLYIDEHKYDSARALISDLDFNNNNYRNKILHNLVQFRINQNVKNYEKSINYLLLVSSLKDSLSYNLLNSRVTEIDKKIELSNNLNEINDLRINKRNILILLILVLVLLIFIVYKLIINKIEYSKQRKYLLSQIFSFEDEMSVLSINNFENRITLHNKILTKTMNLLSLRNYELKTRDKQKINEFAFESLSKDLITDNDWQIFIIEIDQIFDKKIAKLIEQYQITFNDQKVISLISLSFDITDCTLLLNISKNTLYHRRQMIKERLKLSKDTDLDAWLIQYLTADLFPAGALPSPPAP